MRGYDCRDAIKAMAIGLGIAVAATASAEAMQLAFPANQSLVPLVVGGAFVTPALMALAFVMLGRLGRRLRNRRGLGTVAGFAFLAVAALAIVGYLQPGLLSFRGS